MKKFFESLRKCAMEIINFKKKNLKLLTNEQQKSFTIAKFSYICNKKKIEYEHAKDEKYRKVEAHCHYTGEHSGAAHSICNLKYKIPKGPIGILLVFYNGSNDHYHFIVKELAVEFKKEFTCLRENTEKYMTFSVPIEK